MIIDSNSHNLSSGIESDICIIGAGAAGISIAREFIGSNVQVTLLESGGFEFDQATQALYEGENTGRDYFPLNTTRLRFLGGSTNHWGGMCGPLDPLDFEARDWIPDSGWPLTFDDLDSFYARAQPVCQLGPYDYGSAYWEPVIAAKPLAMSPEKFQTKMIQYSPPTRFGSTYRKALKEAGNIRLVLNANVLDIQSNETTSHVKGVKVSNLDGKVFQVRSKFYVLACGGLENARILLLSNSTQKEGLGNAHGLVGRYFMDHPHWDCGIMLPEDPALDLLFYDSAALRRKPGIRTNGFLFPSVVLQKQKQMVNSMIEFEPVYQEGDDGLMDKSGNFLDRIGRMIKKKGLIDQDTFRTYLEKSRVLTAVKIRALSEQVPNRNSMVSLSTDRDSFGQNRLELKWELKSVDTDAVIHLLETFALELGSSGLGRLKLDFMPLPGWPAGHHHMGTTRMHNDKKSGVVDASCQVHGISNLFVAGSSVFPTGGVVNPTFTIVALALRLADHFKKAMK